MPIATPDPASPREHLRAFPAPTPKGDDTGGARLRDDAATASAPSVSELEAKLRQRRDGKIGVWLFTLALIVGAVYTGFHLVSDLSSVRSSSVVPFLPLGLALLIALGFEFVNGFHDTANAVATVIYTHSLDPHVAVAWSGAANFIGVLTSSGAVAFGIVSLLPIELVLQVGSGGAGFAMVFALLVAAIVWNLGTWYFGLPASSSHALIGSILGVGVANQLLMPRGTSGVNWGQALGVGKALLISPLVGFVGAALLLLLAKKLIPRKELYEAPRGEQPPPFWIRCLLILTCTGVSFAHGSNDGQKGMGLIMLILIGTVPTAYALNRAVTPAQSQEFLAASRLASETLGHHGSGPTAPTAPPAAQPAPGGPHVELTEYVHSRKLTPATLPALRGLIDAIATDMASYEALAHVPPETVRRFRYDTYLVSEALHQLQQSGQPQLTATEQATLGNYKARIDDATKFIPTWVKVAVAIALGLGTMVGWKRIAITVGEKIGKNKLTYAQGAAAEIVAMATIEAADRFGMPVSTTHVLSSGVAGTMVANGSGLQWSTLRKLAMAWVLTVPASILLAGTLFWIFRQL